MRAIQRRAVGLAVMLLLTGYPAAGGAHAEPAFLRSLPTGNYRAVATRADGTALLVKQDGVIRRDPAGGTRFVARLRANQRVTAAAGAHVFGIATYADNAPSTLHVARFELLSDDGTRRWSISKPRASEFRISPSGDWTLGIAGGDGMLESELFLYDAEGKEVATWTVPYLSDLTLTAGGERFFAASRGELFAFPLDGGERQSLGRFEAFGVSDDGRWVALAGAGTLSVFEGSKLVFTAPTDLALLRRVAVSPQGRYIALLGGDRLQLFTSETRGLAWTVSSGRPELHFISAAISEAPLRILGGLDFDAGPDVPNGKRHTHGAVFLLNSEGGMLWREDLKYKSWNLRVPRVAFTGGGRQFEVELADELRQYSLP